MKYIVGPDRPKHLSRAIGMVLAVVVFCFSVTIYLYS